MDGQRTITYSTRSKYQSEFTAQPGTNHKGKLNES